jgi:hypothetical protein
MSFCSRSGLTGTFPATCSTSSRGSAEVGQAEVNQNSLLVR